MALRNAFENLATEAKQDGIISLLKALVRSTSYARTSGDLLRVNVDNAPQTLVYNGNSGTTQNAAGSVVTWYSANSWNAVDARDQMMQTSAINVTQAMQRWTVT